MTKEQAIYKFWNSFGIPAYADTVDLTEDEATLPYITYEVKTASHGGDPVQTAVSIWYKTTSEAIPNKKVDEISKRIGDEGELLECDDGLIYVYKGNPWCSNRTGQDDDTIKLRLLNVTYKFYTL